MVESTSNLTSTQRYAAEALFTIALNQTQPLGIPTSENDNEDGLEETANSSPAKHHIGSFTRLLSEEASDASAEMIEQEMALGKAADAMVQSIQSSVSIDVKKEKHQEYENECHEKYEIPEVKPEDRDAENDKKESADSGETKSLDAGVVIRDGSHKPEVVEEDKSVKEVTLLSHQRKINVLYELGYGIALLEILGSSDRTLAGLDQGTKEPLVADEQLGVAEVLEDAKALEIPNGPMTRSQTRQLNQAISMLVLRINGQLPLVAHQTALVVIRAKEG